jgi:hypothetical protein
MNYPPNTKHLPSSPYGRGWSQFGVFVTECNYSPSMSRENPQISGLRQALTDTLSSVIHVTYLSNQLKPWAIVTVP